MNVSVESEPVTLDVICELFTHIFLSASSKVEFAIHLGTGKGETHAAEGRDKHSHPSHA
jgi:hypothetical protein